MSDIPIPTHDIIELAWRDEVSFDDIQMQTGLTEKQVIATMRRHMKPSSFRMWRKRVTGRTTKHKKRRIVSDYTQTDDYELS